MLITILTIQLERYLYKIFIGPNYADYKVSDEEHKKINKEVEEQLGDIDIHEIPLDEVNKHTFSWYNLYHAKVTKMLFYRRLHSSKWLLLILGTFILILITFSFIEDIYA